MTTSSKTATALAAAAVGSAAFLAVALPHASGAGHQDGDRPHRRRPRDRRARPGRPVVLVAAGLGVPTEVFRKAFSGVTPAGAGEEPDPAQVQRNKEALLKVLGPYGVTNDELDRVSNHYRYQAACGRDVADLRGHREGDRPRRQGRVDEAGARRRGLLVNADGHRPGLLDREAEAPTGYGKNLSTNGRVASIKVLR